jgi:hypothetical protein
MPLPTRPRAAPVAGRQHRQHAYTTASGVHGVTRACGTKMISLLKSCTIDRSGRQPERGRELAVEKHNIPPLALGRSQGLSCK